MAYKIRNAHHMRSQYTTTSRVLVHTEHSGSGSGRIFEHTAAILASGEFSSTVIHTDDTGAQQGRFAEAPGGQAVFCNEVETKIWAGNEMPVAAAFLTLDATWDGTENPIDVTDEINNTLQDSANCITINAAANSCLALFTTRPAKGFKFYIKTANASAATMDVEYYKNTAAFVDVSNDVDGTDVGGKTLAQTGTYAFDTTVSDAEQYNYQGVKLYCYRFILSAGSAVIYQVTADCPMQDMVDVWDGVYRQIVGCDFNDNGTVYSYVLDIQNASYVSVPYGAEIGALVSANDKIEIMAEESLTGLVVAMIGAKVNTNASVLTLKYWNGTAAAAVSGQSDGTSLSGASLGQNGVIAWQHPSAEVPRTHRGVTGYYYSLEFSADFSGAAASDIVIDTIYGIPAPKTVMPFKFPALYKDRTFLFGAIAEKQGAAADFTMAGAPDVWNGEETSDGGRQRLHFPTSDELVGAAQVFNRYGNSIRTVLSVFGPATSFILDGDGPDDYRIYPLSSTIGIPAPLTITTAEIGFEMAEDVTRNVVFGLSYAGPIAFDGSTIKKIDGLEKFFDPSDSEYVNLSMIHRAVAAYDPIFMEWHLIFATGSSTTLNKWVVLSLRKQPARWFEIVPTEYPQAIWAVVDANGGRHLYGALDSGYMVRLNYGQTWAGDDITYKLKTGDWMPSGSPWDQTEIEYVKTMWKRITEASSMTLNHYADTATTATALSAIDLSAGSNRLSWNTQHRKLIATTHCLEWEVSTGETDKGLQFMGWGVKWNKTTDDLTSAA